MLDVVYAECLKYALYAECHYAECSQAECHYAECRYAECHGALHRSIRTSKSVLGFACSGFSPSTPIFTKLIDRIFS